MRRQAFVQSGSKKGKGKGKNTRFLSQLVHAQRVMNDNTGAKFCLHDLNFHSFDEMRADCKFFCEPPRAKHGDTGNF